MTRLGAVLIIALVGLAATQEVWEQPYQNWTKKDIEKIAGDSPWAQTKQAENTLGYSTYAAVTLRLRSALPIRQALLRLKQLDAKYDKMNANERAAFDVKMKGILECPACADNYVVSLGPPISNKQILNGVISLKHATLESLKGYVYLANERGERRELVHFIAPYTEADEATFFFPRFDGKGQPLLAPGNKKLIIHFDPPGLAAQKAPLPTLFEFDVSRLVRDGEVAF
jgi:hypothetical protein